MPSSALCLKVITLQDGSDLLTNASRACSNLAQELSSLASTLSFKSHGYAAEAEKLDKAAERLKAGGSAMESDSSSDVSYRVAVARMEVQPNLAEQTARMHNHVEEMRHDLAVLLADQNAKFNHEPSRSLKRKRQSAEKGQDRNDGDCHQTTCLQQGVECKNATHAPRQCGDTNYSITSPSSQSEGDISGTSEEGDSLSSLVSEWKAESDARDDELDADGWPSSKTSDNHSCSESVETEIYSSDLPPSFEEAMAPLESMELMGEEYDTVGKFLRDPYELATRNDALGNPTTPRSFILESAERAANQNLASGPLVNCAAAFV